MRSLLMFVGENKIREKYLVSDAKDPGKPGEKQVRTQTLFSCISNGTERNMMLRGNYAPSDDQLPRGFGYLNVGKVVEIGKEVERFQVGDTIYTSSDHQEFILKPESFLSARVPERVDHAEATLFGLAGVAMRTCRHAEIKMGERVLIVGAGIIGQIAAQIASHMGGVVTICDINQDRLEIARSIGAADHVMDSSGDGWAKIVDGIRYQVILDFAGVPDMENQLVAALVKRGRLLFVAGRFKVTYNFMWGNPTELTVMQNSHFDQDDLDNVARWFAKGYIKVGPLISHRVPVAEARGLYDQLRDNPQSVMGMVLAW